MMEINVFLNALFSLVCVWKWKWICKLKTVNKKNVSKLSISKFLFFLIFFFWSVLVSKIFKPLKQLSMSDSTSSLRIHPLVNRGFILYKTVCYVIRQLWEFSCNTGGGGLKMGSWSIFCLAAPSKNIYMGPFFISTQGYPKMNYCAGTCI